MISWSILKTALSKRSQMISWGLYFNNDIPVDNSSFIYTIIPPEFTLRLISAIASQLTDNSTVCLRACSDEQWIKQQNAALLTLCEGKPLVTNKFPSQRTKIAGSVSIAWRRHTRDMVSLFNSSPPSAAYMRQWIGSALVQIMACRLFGAKPLSKPMLGYCQLDPQEQISVTF